MQNPNFWYQQYLSRQEGLKYLTAFLFIFSLSLGSVNAQWFRTKKRGSGKYTEDVSYELARNRGRLSKPLNFGFHLAGFGTNFSHKLTDDFINSNDPTGIITVNPKASFGFATGFYSNFRIGEFWDVRVEPQAAFYERQIEYTFADGNTESKIIEGSSFEIPILFKYRSQLRGIKGMYMVAGVKPIFSLSQRKEDDENVLITSSDFAIEYGFGFDVFFPYFKFAPELRFSHGFSNVLDKAEVNNFNRPIKRLGSHSVTLYLHFGG